MVVYLSFKVSIFQLSMGNVWAFSAITACRHMLKSLCLRLLGESRARQPKKIDFVLRGAVASRKIGQDFSDDAAELVTVTGAWRCQNNLLMLGMMINDEMLIRRVREHASAKSHGRPFSCWKIAACKLAQQRFVRLIDLASQQVRSATLSAMMVAAELEARNFEDREAIVTSFFDVDIEDWKSLRREPFRTLRL